MSVCEITRVFICSERSSKKAIIIELVESAILNGNMLLAFKMNVGCSTSKQDRVMVANSNVRD